MVPYSNGAGFAAQKTLIELTIHAVISFKGRLPEKGNAVVLATLSRCHDKVLPWMESAPCGSLLGCRTAPTVD